MGHCVARSSHTASLGLPSCAENDAKQQKVKRGCCGLPLGAHSHYEEDEALNEAWLAAGPGGLAPRDVHDALQEFASRGADLVRASAGEAGDALWDAACDLIEGILSGVRAQLPGLAAGAQVVAGGPGEPLVLLVRFARGPLVGDFATRSRIGFEFHLGREVSFALLQPPPSAAGPRPGHEEAAAAPLVLRVAGLEFRPLPEAQALRLHLQRVLGRGFGMGAAYDWWEGHKEEVCPLDRSKLRWVIESILGLRTIQAVARQVAKAKMLWGFLHCRQLVVESLSFWDDGERGVCMTATAQPPQSPEEAHVEKVYDSLIATMPRQDLSMGEFFMPSSMNWLALFHAHALGQRGANPTKIRKLLSAAAAEWGPAQKGWQRSDPTWSCVDKRDVLGRVVEEQGRVVWRQPGWESHQRAPLEL